MTSSLLLITSPWRHPGEPALGLALLRGILERAGVQVSNLYAMLLYPRTELDSRILDQYGSLIFAPWMEGGPSPAAARDAILSRYVEDISLKGIRCAPAEARRRLPAWLPNAVEQEIERASKWLERTVKRVLEQRVDVLGFSITFESQLPATLALIQQIKARCQGVRVMLGGSACQEEQAGGILTSFPQIDAVCYSEGEEVIVPLSLALLGHGALAEVPGIVYRDEGGRMRRTAAPALCRDLDALPVPRYDDFLEQLGQSEWHDVPVRLSFETSRGCWWGQKHLCTFCGLNGEGLAFRAKSPERAYEEIRSLYLDYPQAHYLLAADNIIAMPYFEHLLPRLARLPRQRGRPLQIFYEIKSNLQPEQVALLAAAGIRTVQPGIESFSDEVLRLMDKGATGLSQIQFIKWAAQAEIATTYSFLLRNPGESAESYRQMIALLPSLHHLPPPDGVVLTEIERFSLYHRYPERYGLTNLRPHTFYRSIFPDPRVDVSQLAYQFDYDHPIKEDEELRAAHRALCDAVDAWRLAYRRWAAYYVDQGDHLVLVDHRPGARQREQVLRGIQASLFRYLDRQRPLSAIRARFPGLDETILLSQLDRWEHDRLLCAMPGGLIMAAERERRFLAVLPRRGPAPASETESRPRRAGMKVQAS